MRKKAIEHNVFQLCTRESVAERTAHNRASAPGQRQRHTGAIGISKQIFLGNSAEMGQRLPALSVQTTTFGEARSTNRARAISMLSPPSSR